MSINVSIPNKSFDFSDMSLGEPYGIARNEFFSKILIKDDIYIQTPEIKSKEGFVNNSKKTHIDLIFDKSNEDIIEWFENLEEKLHSLIFEKKDEWFQDSNIEKADIENIFISPLKTIKSGKQFSLRTYLDNPKSLISKKDIKIYDDHDNKLSLDDVKSTTKFIGLLHINGLKFSSKNFQVHVDIKEILKVTEEDNNKYIIKKISRPQSKKNIVNELNDLDKVEKEGDDSHNNDNVASDNIIDSEKEVLENNEEIIEDIKKTQVEDI